MCIHGCVFGKFGDICGDNCGLGCVDQTCKQQNGVCTGGCLKNWAGVRCDRCDDTHYGTNCSLECSVYCKDGCSRDSGTCNSCIEGNYGDTCDKKCGAGCVSGCNRYNGSCVCKPGWQGDRCDECSPFYHGDSCNNKCSSNCLHGTCFVNNGSCVDGCKCSIVEELQSQVQQLQKSDASSFQYPLYIVSVLFSLSVAVNVLFIIRYFRGKLVRQTGQAENQGVVGPSSTNDAAPHPEIYEKVEGNDGYQELGDLSRPSLYDGLDQNKL